MRRITIALPTDLLDAADAAVREGRATSRAALIIAALRRELMDSGLAPETLLRQLAADQDLEAEARLLAAELDITDLQAFQDMDPR